MTKQQGNHKSKNLTDATLNISAQYSYPKIMQILKGLSGEMWGGSQVVLIDRYYFRDLPMVLLFLFYGTPIK
jgi:hypothetical protein